MTQKFSFSTTSKSGIITKILLTLRRNDYRTVEHVISHDGGRYLLHVMLDSPVTITTSDLQSITAGVPEIMSIEEVGMPIHSTSAEQIEQPLLQNEEKELIYRGRIVDQSVSESTHHVKKTSSGVNMYRGHKVDETVSSETVLNDTHQKVKKKYTYRGQSN